ncbi:MAG: hypothetical protein MZW92_39610 [Comamonadaceae bacterium]|nr:hypothetical protein [Comamonadaceae bacterium]
MKRRQLIAALCGLAVTAGAQAMDPRFRDANGDLVADAPTEAKEFVDPPTLVFAYTPVEDPVGLRQSLGRLPAAPGESHRQEGPVLPGAEQRGTDRGDARRPAAHRGLQHRHPRRWP